MNFTFTVPEGSMNHGNPNLLCTPAEWYDLIIFFFANYFAHAASVILEPGQGSASTGLYILLALTLPGAGVSRAIRAILRHAVTERKNPLKRAARAGALCMVLKKPEDGRYARLLRRQMQGGERPVEIEIGQTEEKTTETETETEQLATTTANQELDEVSAVANVDEERKEAQGSSKSRVFSTPSSDSPWWDPPGGYTPVPLATDIHGEHWLCDNSTYYLAMVPPIASMKLDFDAKKDGVVKQGPSNQPNAVIASSYNLPKLFIGFIQAVWAVITIYRTRGDQIQQYGYAAFGLTVAPYATMSILNTLANMLTPDYPCMFLIRTPMMNKAEEEGEGFFKGALRVKLQDANPVIVPTDDSPSPPTSYEYKPLMTVCIAFFCSLIPLGIVGGLSGFQPGNSSQMERGFTMSWLVIGILYGLVCSYDWWNGRRRNDDS
ncbi:uncharacterized protein TrAtP1_011744 [Trichoderma atroviride]|uniref:uncharacterized protein n=1 Tax=Hypocrea atroviridis TaxID=63577 RepID=UPI003316A43E|nr:hypothetical protein TrAtP1_011744 [Trichoderma atroviride]